VQTQEKMQGTSARNIRDHLAKTRGNDGIDV
jgi:hypothetical protein